MVYLFGFSIWTATEISRCGADASTKIIYTLNHIAFSSVFIFIYINICICFRHSRSLCVCAFVFAFKYLSSECKNVWTYFNFMLCWYKYKWKTNKQTKHTSAHPKKYNYTYGIARWRSSIINSSWWHRKWSHSLHSILNVTVFQWCENWRQSISTITTSWLLFVFFHLKQCVVYKTFIHCEWRLTMMTT